MNVLIINGHVRWARISNGKLNRAIGNMANLVARECGHSVNNSEADRFFAPYTEVEKFQWADKVIIHFPVNWLGLPGKFKTYLDTVLIAGEGKLYNGGKRKLGSYCSGGRLHGKEYFLIATWSTQQGAFFDSLSFFNGREPDDVLFNVHCLFRFLGMTKGGSFHFFDVYKNNAVVDDLKKCQEEIHSFLGGYRGTRPY